MFLKYANSKQKTKSSVDTVEKINDSLTKRFQRRRFFYISTNQKKEMHVAAMFVNGTGRNRRSL
jgi:hypothetical protein